MGIGLVAKKSPGRRGGMTLVRLRKGVYADGSIVDVETRVVPPRVVHLIDSETARLDPEEKWPWEKRLPAVVSCCGATFQPGTLEEVPWGTERPHKLCTVATRIPESYIERNFLDAQEVARHTAEAESDGASFALVSETLQELLNDRDDWEFAEDVYVWTYTASFSGVFTRDERFPRGRDLGLELLELTYAGGMYIRVDTCGIREGCPEHLSKVDLYAVPDNVESLKNQLTSLESMPCRFT